MRFLSKPWWANCGVSFPRHEMTLGRAGHKPEGAIIKIALAPQSNNSPIESHTSPPLSSRPIRSKTASVSTLVPNMSSGRLEPSPRTLEFIHLFALTASFSNRERAAPYTAINATRRSLSVLFSDQFSPFARTSLVTCKVHLRHPLAAFATDALSDEVIRKEGLGV